MDATKEKAFIQFIVNNRISVAELFNFLNEPKPGYFHFTDGSYFPEIIPGLSVNGVYIKDGYCASKFERNGKTGIGNAGRFCSNRNVSLPPYDVRNEMVRQINVLNEAFLQLGWPKMTQFESYWAQGDSGGSGSGPDIIFMPGGMPGDDIIVSGSGETYKKHVRGVFKVSKVLPKLQVDAEEALPQSEQQAFPLFVKALGLSMTEFSDFIEGKMKLPKAGDYLLKNGNFSPVTVYDQEWGIYLNENVYILLDMLKAPLTVSEANVVCSARDYKMPTQAQLELLETKLPEVNKALKAVGMDDFCIPADVLQSCWYREMPELANGTFDPSTKRRLLVFGEKPNISENYLILQRLMTLMNISL